MLEDATHNGLQNLVTHIHTYQQLMDPQSTPSTSAPISPQQIMRPQSPPEGGKYSRTLAVIVEWLVINALVSTCVK